MPPLLLSHHAHHIRRDLLFPHAGREVQRGRGKVRDHERIAHIHAVAPAVRRNGEIRADLLYGVRTESRIKVRSGVAEAVTEVRART